MIDGAVVTISDAALVDLVSSHQGLTAVGVFGDSWTIVDFSYGPDESDSWQIMLSRREQPDVPS